MGTKWTHVITGFGKDDAFYRNQEAQKWIGRFCSLLHPPTDNRYQGPAIVDTESDEMYFKSLLVESITIGQPDPIQPEPARGGHSMFYEILEKMKDIHSRKNHDYTGGGDPLSNLRMCEEAGIPAWKGVVVRLGDKYSRLNTFSKLESYQVKDESVEDTFLDNAIYSILGLILYREANAKKSKE